MVPMWMPAGDLLQSMLNQSHLLNWTKIAYHEANNYATEPATIVRSKFRNRYKMKLTNSWCQASDYFLFDALQVAFSQAMEHQRQSHTMLSVSAPNIERLKLTATEVISAGYKFDKSISKGTQQIINVMFLR